MTVNPLFDSLKSPNDDGTILQIGSHLNSSNNQQNAIDSFFAPDAQEKEMVRLSMASKSTNMDPDSETPKTDVPI